MLHHVLPDLTCWLFFMDIDLNVTSLAACSVLRMKSLYNLYVEQEDTSEGVTGPSFNKSVGIVLYFTAAVQDFEKYV